MKTYYELLSIQESASEHDIIAAYRLAVRKYHSDLHPGDDSAAKLVRHLNRAREILCDPVRRKKYDEHLERRRAPILAGGKMGPADEKTSARQEQGQSPEVASGKQVGKKSAVQSDKPSASASATRNTEYRTQYRRGRKKQPRILLNLIGIVGGGIGGIGIGLVLVWYLWDIDPMGMADVQLSGESTREQAGLALDQQEATSSLTKPNIVDAAPPLVMDANKPGSSSQPIVAVSEIAVKPSGVVEQPDPSATPELASEIIEVIPSLADRSRSGTFQVPTNATSIKVAFFGKDASLDSLPRYNPGYNGLLKVNGKMIVAYARKYKWKGDGKWYSLAYVHDGTELNSRDPNMPQIGWYDVTQFVQLGEECKIEYKNGQRTPIGVRILLELSSGPESIPPPTSLSR